MRGMVQQRLCLACSIPFEVPPTSKRQFCSQACTPKTSRGPACSLVSVECAHCGKEFERKAWEIEKRRKQGWALYCSTACRDAARRGRKNEQRVERQEFVCPQCGKSSWHAPHELRRKKFCSSRCAAGAKAGRPRPRNGNSYTSTDGYRFVYIPPEERPVGHENTTYQPEHRLVMAGILGRWPASNETVHHVNGDKADNRPENLQLRIGSHGYGIALRCRCCGSSDIETVELT